MGKKSDRKTPGSLSDEAIVDYFANRIFLFYDYHFGRFDRKRLELRSRGDVNWRVIRYKHITNPDDSLYPIDQLSYITPRTFKKHAKYLASNCNVIKVDELLQRLESGAPIEDNTVAITFDCAYRDVFQNAIPTLVKYNLPATVFVPTAYPDTNNMFWTDKVVGALTLLKIHGFEYPFFE